jgi:hypothetical protein
MSAPDDAELALPADRRLNESEAENLQSQLRLLFTDINSSNQDDIGDLIDYTMAMISNGKSVAYMVQDLIGLEMEFCPAVTCRRIGNVVASFLKPLLAASGQEVNETAAAPKKANALLLVGALGASRTPKGTNAAEKKNPQGRFPPRDNRGGKSDGGRGGKSDVGRGSDSRGRDLGRGRVRGEVNGRSDRRAPAEGHRDAPLHDRRLPPRQDEQRGGNARGGRLDQRGGQRGRVEPGRRPDRFGDAMHRLSGRGEGRSHGDVMNGRGRHDGRMGPPDGPWGRHHAPEEFSRRRGRDELQDEPDFVPATGGRAPWRGGGRGGGGYPEKYPRLESQDYHQEGDDGGYHFGRGRGGRFARGGGRAPPPHGRGGRFEEGGPSPIKNDVAPAEETADTWENGTAAHPSPIVAYSAAARGFRGGRGFRGSAFRGGFRAPRGGGREAVHSILAANTWVRKKEEAPSNSSEAVGDGENE